MEMITSSWAAFLMLAFACKLAFLRLNRKLQTKPMIENHETIHIWKIHYKKINKRGKLYFWDWFFQVWSKAVADWTSWSEGNCGARRSRLNWSAESKAKPSCASPFNLGSEFLSSLDFPYSSIAFICSWVRLYASSQSFFTFSTASTTLSIQISPPFAITWKKCEKIKRDFKRRATKLNETHRGAFVVVLGETHFSPSLEECPFRESVKWKTLIYIYIFLTY